MKQKVMDAMQSFARALMGPVLFLPIAGMLQAISSVMSNTALVTEGGVVWTLGKFINGGVSAVIGNLGILFCVGIAMSLAKKRKADAAFLALVSYLVWLAANSRWLDVAGLTIAGDTASALYGTGQTICLGYHVTDMGVFLGMILGVVVALVHNRFIDTEFEGAMAMYGNSKFVFVVLLELIDYCEKYAKPTYWIVNYSNPAAIVAKATFRLRPKARILNICDMPVAIERNMAEILECDRHDLEVDYFGLNHFGWFTKVRLNGEDVTEKLKSYVAEHGYMPQNAKSDVLHSDPSWLHTYANAKNICSAFHDYLPNTYMQYYLLGDEIVKSSDPNHTRANEVMEGREKRIFDAVADYRAGKDVDLTKFFGGVHGEFIVDVAMSLAFDLRKRYLVMVENNGAVENLPSDAMVEVPAYITDRGPEPVRVGEIPTFYKGLIEQQEAVEKLIVDAAVEHSYEKALMAFTLSKTVPSLLVAKKILDDMIVANKAYWPELH